jgi:hypothetical protein
LDPALHLLHDMPGLVGQMLLLSGADVDVCALSVGQRVELGWTAGVEVDPHRVERDTRERFDPGFEAVG